MRTPKSHARLRIGLYAWGGPGTVRLLKTKYHSPNIDEDSFLTLYDSKNLKLAKSIFGVTDMWITYSWGFSDATEKKDRYFLRSKLDNFKAHSISTHAYVQGLNVVTHEFPVTDLYCRDLKGRLLPYSKGRSLTCPNNPNATSFIRSRVEEACREDVDGIFVDNILFGLPPFYWRRDFISFFGCSCKYCRTTFARKYGYSLPMRSIRDTSVLSDYRTFRADSVKNLVYTLSHIVKSAGKQFGVNLYDPYNYTPEIYFGYSLNDISSKLSYYLIENHALDQEGSVHNTHLLPLISRTKKPVFVVSYRQGIGIDGQMLQSDFNALRSDAYLLGYSPCYKATEYKTRGVWHALRYEQLEKPEISIPGDVVTHIQRIGQKKSSVIGRLSTRLLGRYYATVMQHIFERRVVAAAIQKTGIYSKALRTSRYYPQDTYE